MSQEEEPRYQGQSETFSQASGMFEQVTDPTDDVPGRSREHLFGWISKLSALTKLDPKPKMAQMYGLKAHTIFQKFTFTYLELEENNGQLVNELINAENNGKQRIYLSAFPKPFVLESLKQVNVKETVAQAPVAAPPKKSRWGF